jgi:hypothetical protein
MAPLRASQRPGLRCVAHDLRLGVIQVVLAGRLTTALQADRALRATQADAHLVILDLREVQFIGCTAARAPASRFVPLARLHRRFEIVVQFPRTTVQEVPV